MEEVVFTNVSDEEVLGDNIRASKFTEFMITNDMSEIYDKSSRDEAPKPFVKLRGCDTLEDLYKQATARNVSFSEPDTDDFDESLGKYSDDEDEDEEDEDDDDDDDDDDVEDTKTFFSLKTRSNLK